MRRSQVRLWGAFTAAATTLVLSATLIACGGGNQTSSLQSPAPTGAAAHDAVLLQGRELYDVHCAQCHGVSGGGGSGPSFTDGKLLLDFPTAATQISFVHKRRIGSALTATQLRAVVRYEREVLSIRR
jgi:mono/diheme cytochrome c family protein